MNGIGIVLVHGYSGQVSELAPLSRLLVERYGQRAVRAVHLPGHADGTVPDFDAIQFGNHIDEAVHSFRKENRSIILIGHSTGGTLALDHLQRTGNAPALLILAATPAVIQGGDLNRWEQHRRNRSAISLLNVARMVSWVNRVSAARINTRFQVLILQGGSDPLVPPSHAEIWCRERFPKSARSLIVPRAGHGLFNGPGSGIALDTAIRAISDTCRPIAHQEQADARALSALDADMSEFMAARPQSVPQLVASPAAARALNKPMRFDPVAKTEPMQLNIEITTRCNLGCGHCARSLRPRSGRDMDLQVFEYILDLMPHAFRVVLVGLGEPTLHPQLVDFVALAAQRGHGVGFVTNAMDLDKAMSRSLISAGLGSLTFSLDSVDPDTVSSVRPGSDLDRITGHIRTFTALAGDKVSTAVFTAVSERTVHLLPSLAVAVAGLGVKAWMLSDLNFDWNESRSLWRNWTRTHQEHIATAMKESFSRSLPMMSVHGLEELGLASRYRDFLVTAPAALHYRSTLHTWCLSPWQTLPVDAHGNAAVCDCRPEAVLGNLLDRPFAEIWNGAAMQAHRRLMRSAAPPADCLVCPRF